MEETQTNSTQEAPNLSTILSAQKVEILTDETVTLDDGAILYFNKNLKITHKQKKFLNKSLFVNTGMKLQGNDQTFDHPEILLENLDNQAEMLVGIFWNTEVYWRTQGGRGNFWDTRSADTLSADVITHMSDLVQNKVDPMKVKALKDKAEQLKNG